jgi:hypothetical protein
VVAKVYGFLTGAGITAAAIFGFNAWRNVSDEDRLTLVITDHCLPYVTAGELPFNGMGRAIGVYDGITSDKRIINGGAAVIFEARFVAEWGVIAEPPVRICMIYGIKKDAVQQVFEVAPDGFIGRVTRMMESFDELRPDVLELDMTDGRETLVLPFAWREHSGTENKGLNVTITISGQLIAGVIIFDEFVPKP